MLRMSIEEFSKRTAGGFLASPKGKGAKTEAQTQNKKKRAQSGLKTPSKLENKILPQIRALKIPEPLVEHRFCERFWRFDFAWPDYKVALELEGGTWTHGKTVKGKKQVSRHLTGKGFYNDCRKYNRAAALGWIVVRADAQMVKAGYAVDDLLPALRLRGFNGSPQ